METALPRRAPLKTPDPGLAATIAEHSPRLRAFVRRQLHELADVEDVVQEVLTELAAAVALAKPIQHLAAWLAQVARHRIIDRYRTRGREVSLSAVRADDGADSEESEGALIDALPADTAQQPDELLERERMLDRLEAALAELPPAQREVFIAHEIDGVSFKELAAATGVGINTLLGRKHAAVRALRRRMQTTHPSRES
jgi:RNA polymerase sigma factor (sigma-70 family)